MFRILIVEDDPNTSRLMRLVLKRAGYDPLQAENGAIALEMLDREHVDLIVLDVMMPVMEAIPSQKNCAPVETIRPF